MNFIDNIIKFIKSPKFYGPVIIIVVSIIIYTLISKAIDKATTKGKDSIEKKKRTTIILLFKNIVKYIIIILAVIGILSIYSINTGSLVAGIGVAGAVIGLAFQDALKDIIGGTNVILDNYYVVGDLVNYNDFTGTVIEFGLKSTKIQNPKGEVLIISNRNMDKIINLSQKKSILLLTIPTAYECDHKKVERILKEVLKKLIKNDNVHEDGTEYLGIDSFDSSSIGYLIKIKCTQGKQFEIKREAFKLIKEAYEKNNIKIPYNQMEVHNDN